MTAAGNTSTSHERWTMKTGRKTDYRLDKKSVMSVGWFSLLLSCPNWKLLFKLDQKNTTASPTSGGGSLSSQWNTSTTTYVHENPTACGSQQGTTAGRSSNRCRDVKVQVWTDTAGSKTELTRHRVAFPSWHLTQNMQLSKHCTNKDSDVATERMKGLKPGKQQS